MLFTANRQHLVLAAFGFGLIAAIGCQVKGGSTPPGPASITSSGSGINFTYEQWTAGLSVIFVDDLKGGHGSGSSSSTSSPVCVVDGHGGMDALGYKWHLETPDGKTATTFKIDGTDHDLANGALFVVKAKDGKVEVHQLKRDMSAFPFNANATREALEKDEELRKILGKSEVKSK